MHFFAASDAAQWISALTPLVVLLLLPALRWAIRGVIVDEVEKRLLPVQSRLEGLKDRLDGIDRRLGMIETRSHRVRKEDS